LAVKGFSPLLAGHSMPRVYIVNVNSTQVAADFQSMRALWSNHDLVTTSIVGCKSACDAKIAGA
jgi:hypothetical protein